MDPHSLLWNYLWIAPHVLQAVLAGIIVARGLSRQFPVFLTYVIFDLAQNFVLFVGYHSAAVSVQTYSQIYVGGMIGCIALRFGVIYEVFQQVFRSYPGVEELGKTFLRWGGAILFLVGVGIAAAAPVGQGPPILAALHVTNFVVSVVQSGLLLLLFALSSSLGLSWRSFVFGIAVGMGFFSSVDLATTAIRVALPDAVAGRILDLVTMATYHACVLVWLFYLLMPAPAVELIRALPETNLDRWNAELERLLLR